MRHDRPLYARLHGTLYRNLDGSRRGWMRYCRNGLAFGISGSTRMPPAPCFTSFRQLPRFVEQSAPRNLRGLAWILDLQHSHIAEPRHSVVAVVVLVRDGQA